MKTATVRKSVGDGGAAGPQRFGAQCVAEAERLGAPILLLLRDDDAPGAEGLTALLAEPSVRAAAQSRVVLAEIGSDAAPEAAQAARLSHLFSRRYGADHVALWLTPSGRPFFAAEPAEPEALIETIEAVAAAWSDRAGAVSQEADAMAASIARLASDAAGPFDARAAEAAFSAAYAEAFDAEEGGLLGDGRGKSPMAPVLTLAFDLGLDAPEALERAFYTLAAVEAGASHDQVGGGFFRACLDRGWRAPIPSKPLRLQAEMLFALAAAARVLAARAEQDRDAAAVLQRIRRAGRRTAAFVLRDLRAPDGLLLGGEAAEDASAYALDGEFVVQALAAAGDGDALSGEHGAAFVIESLGLDAERQLETGVMPHLPRGRAADFAWLDPQLDALQAGRAAAWAAGARPAPTRRGPAPAASTFAMVAALADAAGPLEAPQLRDAARAVGGAAWTAFAPGGVLSQRFAGEKSAAARLDDLAWGGRAALALADIAADDAEPAAEAAWRGRGEAVAARILAEAPTPEGRLRLRLKPGPFSEMVDWLDLEAASAESAALGLLGALAAGGSAEAQAAAERVSAAIGAQLAERPLERPSALAAARRLR